MARALFMAALMALPLFAGAQDYFTPLAMNGVELRGMVKFGILDYDYNTRMQKGLYAFDYADKFQPRKDRPLLLCNPSGGCAYHNGKLYVNDYDDSGQVHLQKPHWKVYDAKTYKLLSETELKDNCESTTTSIAYDPTTDKIYGFLSTYTETFFVEVDPATGNVTRIGAQLPYQNKYTAIACNKAGQLYCIYFDKDNSTHYLARIRKSDGRVANVGVLKVGNLLPGDAFVDGGYAQSMFFNNATDKLYWVFQSATQNLNRDEYTPLFEVNTTTATATMTAYMADALLIPGMYFEEPLFSAPASSTNFAFTPTTPNRLTGTLSVTLPATTYTGESISGPLSVVFVEDGDTLSKVQAKAGSVCTTEAITFANDVHHIKVTATNAAGEDGPAADFSFYAGYDKPRECKDITLTADGLTTHLTWKAPTEGQNGAVINPADYTYTVVRYPNEVTVATGLKQMEFSETHPADMTRYVYIVKAVDSQGREGTPAFSNNLIVGTPLRPPYGGPFHSPADMINYYTIVDANNDRLSWSYDTSTACAFYEYSEVNDADDWLISPPITYKKGETYELKFYAWSSNADYPEALQVRAGKTRTPAGQDQLLLDLPEVPYAEVEGDAHEYTTTFTASADSVYHYSFHAVSPAFSFRLYLSDIRVAPQNYDAIGSIPAAPTPGVKVYVDGHRLHIANGQGLRVAVVTAAGAGVIASQAHEIDRLLPSGVYVVRTEKGTQKVIIK